MQRYLTVFCLLAVCALMIWGNTSHCAPFLLSGAMGKLRGGYTTATAKDTPDTKDTADPRRQHVVQVCKEAALVAIRQLSLQDVQQVHLGEVDNPHSLVLAADTLLTGTGHLRQDGFWHDFYFSCEVSLEGGEVLNFSYTLVS